MYTTFKINQDEIAKTICVQRKFANNTCQGHCALKKSLKKLDENERKMETVLKGKIELVYIKPILENNLNLFFDTISNEQMVFHNSKKPNSISKSSFRPPAYFI
jgi:hypothetical protein